jgi:hypothetical protein
MPYILKQICFNLKIWLWWSKFSTKMPTYNEWAYWKKQSTNWSSQTPNWWLRTRIFAKSLTSSSLKIWTWRPTRWWALMNCKIKWLKTLSNSTSTTKTNSTLLKKGEKNLKCRSRLQPMSDKISARVWRACNWSRPPPSRCSKLPATSTLNSLMPTTLCELIFSSSTRNSSTTKMFQNKRRCLFFKSLTPPLIMGESTRLCFKHYCLNLHSWAWLQSTTCDFRARYWIPAS